MPPKGVATNGAPRPGRSAAVGAIVDGYERLMHRLSGHHTPDFLEIAITMPQAKVLYLVAAGRGLHMAELVTRLGVSLSTVSGLVERLVDQGLVTRRDDPVDRRQVVVDLTDAGASFIDRFRELNARQLRLLLDGLDDADLDLVRRGIDVLGAAAERLVASPSLVGTTGKDAS